MITNNLTSQEDPEIIKKRLGEIKKQNSQASFEKPQVIKTTLENRNQASFENKNILEEQKQKSFETYIRRRKNNSTNEQTKYIPEPFFPKEEPKQEEKKIKLGYYGPENIREQTREQINQEFQSSFAAPNQNIFSQTQTFTPEQIRNKQIKEEKKGSSLKPEMFKDVTGINWGLQAQPNKINLNPLRIGAGVGGLIRNTYDTKGGNIAQSFKDIGSSVSNRGILQTGVDIVGNTIYYSVTDPFAAGGEAWSGSKLLNVASKPFNKVQVTPLNQELKTIQFENKGGGLSTEFIEGTSTFEIKKGIFNKKTEIINADIKGKIEGKTYFEGSEPPLFSKSTQKDLSTEYNPTAIKEGQIQVSIDKNKKVFDYASIEQQNKGISSLNNKQTSIYKTENVGKIEGDDLFKTTSRDIKSGDVTYSYSSPIKREVGKDVSNDVFVSAYSSETKDFILNKDLKPKKETFIETKGDFIKPTTNEANLKPELIKNPSQSMEDFLKSKLGDKTEFDKIKPQENKKTFYSESPQVQIFKNQDFKTKIESNFPKSFKESKIESPRTQKTQNPTQTNLNIPKSEIENIINKGYKGNLGNIGGFSFISSSQSENKFKTTMRNNNSQKFESFQDKIKDNDNKQKNESFIDTLKDKGSDSEQDNKIIDILEEGSIQEIGNLQKIISENGGGGGKGTPLNPILPGGFILKGKPLSFKNGFNWNSNKLSEIGLKKNPIKTINELNKGFSYKYKLNNINSIKNKLLKGL